MRIPKERPAVCVWGEGVGWAPADAMGPGLRRTCIPTPTPPTTTRWGWGGQSCASAYMYSIHSEEGAFLSL